MTDTPQRCEPPEEWRDKPGWHWIEQDGWRPSNNPYASQCDNGRHIAWWSGGAKQLPYWRLEGQTRTAEVLYRENWRYIAPVLTPDEIAEREAAAYQRGQREMRQAALRAQPPTAENPHENAYLREHFNGVIEYGKAIAALPIKEKPE